MDSNLLGFSNSFLFFKLLLLFLKLCKFRGLFSLLLKLFGSLRLTSLRVVGHFERLKMENNQQNFDGRMLIFADKKLMNHFHKILCNFDAEMFKLGNDASLHKYTLSPTSTAEGSQTCTPLPSSFRVKNFQSGVGHGTNLKNLYFR